MARRPVAPLGLAAALLVTAYSSVYAHVSVVPTEGPAGGFVSYTFRMPNEKNIATTSLRIEFPADMVVSRFIPKAGWSREVLRDQNGRVTGVSWTGGNLAADEFDEFTISARNPRQPGKIAFRAYQGYADGSVVEWIGGEGADEPAPTVTITEASGPAIDAHGQPTGGTAPAPGGGSNPPSTGNTGGSPDRPAGTSTSGSDLSLFVALGSLVLAFLALALAVVSLMRRPQPA